MQDGAFSIAVRNNAPVVPIFITMEDSDILDSDGFFVQEYTLHILPPIYPDKNLSHSAAKKNRIIYINGFKTPYHTKKRGEIHLAVMLNKYYYKCAEN